MGTQKLKFRLIKFKDFLSKTSDPIGERSPDETGLKGCKWELNKA